MKIKCTKIFLGRPKFKVTEHNDGWSVYLGYGNNRYIQFRYGDIPSIDFNILNHKGSFKIKDTDWLRTTSRRKDIIITKCTFSHKLRNI